MNEFEAVDIGHLEVSDDEVEVFAFYEFEGFRGIAAGSDIVIGLTEDAGEDIIKIYIIVEEEDIFIAHGGRDGIR